MDYSAISHDADHPAGSSPWGSSPAPSPEPHRSVFNASSERVVSPSPYGIDPPATASYSSHDGGASEGYNRPESSGTVSTTEDDGSRPYTAESSDGPAYQQQQQQQQPQQQGFSGRHSQHYESSPYPPEPHSSEGQRHPSNIRQQPRQQVPQYKLQAKITGLERTGRKDPILRFDVYVSSLIEYNTKSMLTYKTNLPKFRTTQFRDVRRTHSEFSKLADHLISSNPEALVPAVPPALTSAGAGTDEDEARVKGSLQRWLNYVCSNEVLMRDDEMVLFVESDFGYSPMVKRKQPATGVRRRVIKQFAPPPDDTPELQEARPIVKLFYLGTMDAGHKVDKLVKARRGES
jgi:hypothetical protein